MRDDNNHREEPNKPASYPEDMGRKGDLVREDAAAFRNIWPAAEGINDTLVSVLDRPDIKFPRQGTYTVEDYDSLPEDRQYELIDGCLFEMRAPGSLHQAISGQLYLQLYQCIERHARDCIVFYAPFDVQLNRDSRTVVQPDLVVLCNYHPHGETAYQGAPDLVIEILSRANRAHDTVRKLKKYRESGVREYWIVDPQNREVHVYDFEREAKEAVYPFESAVEIRISEGMCVVDFGRISEKVAAFYE